MKDPISCDRVNANQYNSKIEYDNVAAKMSHGIRFLATKEKVQFLKRFIVTIKLSELSLYWKFEKQLCHTQNIMCLSKQC